MPMTEILPGARECARKINEKMRTVCSCRYTIHPDEIAAPISAAMREREAKYAALVEAAEIARKEMLTAGWAIAVGPTRRNTYSALRSTLDALKGE